MSKKLDRPHDDVIVDMLREDPDFAREYLAGARPCCWPCAGLPRPTA